MTFLRGGVYSSTVVKMNDSDLIVSTIYKKSSSSMLLYVHRDSRDY